jgi:PadR family transcriptional regulator PadR
MSKEFLGEFEELVLTMAGILQEEAYGNAIVNEIKERVGRKVNLSAVHVTLYRLEDKGFVKSKMGGATNVRGGRRKRIFTVTNAGLSMLTFNERIPHGFVEADSSIKNCRYLKNESKGSPSTFVTLSGVVLSACLIRRH